MASIKLKVLHAMYYDGAIVQPGAILSMPAHKAADALDGIKVALLDPADRPAVLQARQDEVRQQMRRHGRLMADPGSPWSPLN